MFKWDKYKDILKDLIVNQKMPYEMIGKQFGCSGNNIKKVARKLGIELSIRRKINKDVETFNKGKCNKQICLNCGKEYKVLKSKNSKFCSSKCVGEYKYKSYIEEWKSGKQKGLSGEYNLSRHIRRYLLDKTSHKCELCGWGEINKFTNNIPLEIHHKDGNYLNNNEENLQVLCPNCHALTETYKNHNKCGRRGRDKYKH